MSTDRDGTVDDLSEGVFHLPFPPYLRHYRSRTGAEVRQVQLDQLKLTSLAGWHPRSGWSMPRIVETSDVFISYCIQKNYIYTLPMKSVTSEIGPFAQGGCLSCRVSRVLLYFSSLKRRIKTCVDSEVKGEAGHK
jgi:hypothetical protein